MKAACVRWNESEADYVPAVPPCFPNRSAWVLFLMDCQESKVKPFDRNGAYRTDFDFCRLCTLEHAIQMCIDGKCNPSFHRSLKETKHVETV